MKHLLALVCKFCGKEGTLCCAPFQSKSITRFSYSFIHPLYASQPKVLSENNIQSWCSIQSELHCLPIILPLDPSIVCLSAQMRVLCKCELPSDHFPGLALTNHTPNSYTSAPIHFQWMPRRAPVQQTI